MGKEFRLDCPKCDENRERKEGRAIEEEEKEKRKKKKKKKEKRKKSKEKRKKEKDRRNHSIHVAYVSYQLVHFLLHVRDLIVDRLDAGMVVVDGLLAERALRVGEVHLLLIRINCHTLLHTLRP